MPVEGLPDWIEVASFWLGLALLALVVLISFAKWQRDRFRSDTAGRKVARLQCRAALESFKRDGLEIRVATSELKAGEVLVIRAGVDQRGQPYLRAESCPSPPDPSPETTK